MTLSDAVAPTGVLVPHERRCTRGCCQCPEFESVIAKGSLTHSRDDRSAFHKDCRLEYDKLHKHERLQTVVPSGLVAESDIQMFVPAELNRYFGESHRAAQVYGAEHALAVNTGILIDLLLHNRATEGNRLQTWKAARNSAVFERESSNIRKKRRTLMQLIVQNS